jgi:hypothetical protein
MATEIHDILTSVSSGNPQGAPPVCPRRGVGAVVCGLVACVRATFGWLLLFRRKPRRIPVIHEDVVLTPEGAKVWQEVADPDSPVGKPVGHRRRRLTDGDAAV